MPDPNTVKPASVTKSTIGVKDLRIAKITADTASGTTYDAVQKLAGAIEVSISANNADPDVQYADDIEFDVVNPDPELSVSVKLADVPLEIQAMLRGHERDTDGQLIKKATDEADYFALGFVSEKTNHKLRYVWLYKCRAKFIGETYGTKQGTTITRQEPTVEFVAIKRTSDQAYQIMADEDSVPESGTAPTSAWLDTVAEKKASV